MEDEKKKFVTPVAEIIDFLEDDIITGSGDADWGKDDNVDDWGNL